MEGQAAPAPETAAGPPNADPRLAMWAHLAGGIIDLLCIVAWLAWVPPLIIYVTNKDKSRFVAFHALQALIFQLVVVLINLFLWVPGMIGLFFITVPLGFLINIGAFVYALLTALKAKDGEWAEYVLIGEFARKQHGPQSG